MPKGFYPRTPPIDRFWAKVDKTETCWLWTAARSFDGYGFFRLHGKQTKAHRTSYEWFVGPIPEGLTIDHLCRVRHCVNPAHMEPVTNRENTFRGNNLAAQNARKTHCLRGHPLTGDNLGLTISRPGRYCKECDRTKRSRVSGRQVIQ